MSETSIIKLLKTTSYFLVACGLLGIGGVALVSQKVLAKQMNIWHVMPRHEHFTELYFTNYRQLPASVTPESSQTVTFTVHNLEHQQTTYSYKIIATSEDGSAKKQLGHGIFTLEHDRSRITTKIVTLPNLGKRLAVKVDLAYNGIALGDDNPSDQVQSIRYWVTTDKPVNRDKKP